MLDKGAYYRWPTIHDRDIIHRHETYADDTQYISILKKSLRKGLLFIDSGSSQEWPEI